eukprot:TRINITY_DN1577_c1_g1_i1.p1 TRINITY_DN1577_c1_g1~~TRINITY_DN1577_c1_g1_i1.p1  ORF type:complete len:111 (-),score=34.86 TRINITY_DN1577_c1_g1_i1:129-461(-)
MLIGFTRNFYRAEFKQNYINRIICQLTIEDDCDYDAKLAFPYYIVISSAIFWGGHSIIRFLILTCRFESINAWLKLFKKMNLYFTTQKSTSTSSSQSPALTYLTQDQTQQ